MSSLAIERNEASGHYVFGGRVHGQLHCQVPPEQRPSSKLDGPWTMDPTQYGGWYILSPQSCTEVVDILSFTQIIKLVEAHWAGNFIHDFLRLCVCHSRGNEPIVHLCLGTQRKARATGKVGISSRHRESSLMPNFSLSSRCFLSGRHSQ